MLGLELKPPVLAIRTHSLEAILTPERGQDFTGGERLEESLICFKAFAIVQFKN